MHAQRPVPRVRHRGLPVTCPARTLLDLATVVGFSQLRRALAEAEYLRLVTLHDVERVLGRGRPGSAALRRALERHRPQLARTLSVLEERFLELCETYRLPLPEVNVVIAAFVVDAVWRDASVIVELDGHAAHTSPAAFERDRRRDLALRAAGYVVLRYTWRQITTEPEAVAADLRAALASAGA